jgi:hypothetical protein
MSKEPVSAPLRRLVGRMAVLAFGLCLSVGAVQAQKGPAIVPPRAVTVPQRPMILPQRPTLQQRLQAETLSRSRGVDYDTVRSWQRREDARVQHQRNLDADRRRDSDVQKTFKVPRMERNCQTPVFGNKFLPRPCQ